MHRVFDLRRAVARKQLHPGTPMNNNVQIVIQPNQSTNSFTIQVRHRIFGGEFVTDCRKQLILHNLIGWHRATLREGRTLLTNDYLFLRVIGRSAILVIH